MTKSEIADLTAQLYRGYFAHRASVAVGQHPDAASLGPEVEPGMAVQLGRVGRQDGTFHFFDFEFFRTLPTREPELVDDFNRVWLTGALLQVGDALRDAGFFDKGATTRPPVLELVRHMRNGVAHGNEFDIRNPPELMTWPAHNRDAFVKSDLGTVFEVTPAQQATQVLFDFMGPGDVLDVLASVEAELRR